MNDDQRFLASAALDGDVTAGERARADGDPEVVAEVERLRRVRQATQDVDAPDAGRREQAIAAALAAFDTLERPGPAGAPVRPSVVVPPAPSRAARRRHRWMAPVAAAAAVAVIAVGGIVATRNGDDDGDSATDLAIDESAGAQADAPERELTAAAPAPEDATASADAEAGADAATEATASAAAPADTVQELAPTVAGAVLASPEELAAFVTDAPRSADGTPETCSGGTFVGTASYLVDAEAVEVEVFEIEGPHEAVARRVGDCLVVARAALP